MKISKRFTAAAIAAIITVSAGATSAYAATVIEATSHLTTKQSKTEGSWCYGYYKYFDGNNQGSSRTSVEFIAKYQGALNLWYADRTETVMPGRSTEDDIATQKKDSETNWKLVMEVSDNKTGCEAWGYMKNL